MHRDLTVHVKGGGIDRADALKKLEHLVGKAEENLQNALSANTRRAYKSQWSRFVQWCETMGLPSCPCDDKTLLVYLTHRVEKGASVSTVTQAYAAIREEHRMREIDPPTMDGKLYRSWTGARKKASQGRKTKKAKALTPEALKTAVRSARGKFGPRDKALLLIGWCAALRSEEIMNLDRSDISVTDEGMRVQIRRSKTDQWGEGHEIGIAPASDKAFCPIQAWQEYDADADPERLPAFVSKSERRLSFDAVSCILQRRLKRAGLDVEGYTAHSLRAGCITAAAVAGHSLAAIQRQSRHKSLDVLAGYIRTATLLQQNVTKGLL